MSKENSTTNTTTKQSKSEKKYIMFKAFFRNQKNQSATKTSSQSSTRNTALLIVLIMIILGVTEWTKHTYDYSELSSIISSSETKANNASINAKIQLAQEKLDKIEKSCKGVKEDYKSCMEKLEICIKTDKQFADLNEGIIFQENLLEMVQASDECEKVNKDNEELNKELEKKIAELEEMLKQFS